MRTTLGLWGPVLAWMAVLFAASAQSDVSLAGGVPDWISHGAGYLALGLLLARARAGGFGRPLSWRGAGLVVLLGTGYGVSDELHQAFVPGRQASALDVIKDLAGAALGAASHRLRATRPGPERKEMP